MTTAATSLLGLALPVTAELSGTWGDVVNNSITSLLDTAIAGTTTLSTDGDVTLTTTTLAANQARQAILLCSGARTAIRTITAPAQSKIYTIINATTGGFSVKLVGVGPTTGLTIPNGASAVVAWNGSDFIEIGSSTIGNLTVNGNLTVTGTTTLTGAATLTANPTLSAGTANGVAYLNGSKAVTTGSELAFDGNALTLGGSAPLLKSNMSGSQTTRFGIQNSTTNGNTRFYLYPNGTGNISAINMWNNSDPTATNYSSLDIGIVGTSDIRFSSSASGTGANLPFTWYFASEAMRLTSTGLGIGLGGGSPAYKLDVRGSAQNGIYYKSSGNYGAVVADNSSTTGGGAFSAWTNGAQKAAFGTSGWFKGDTSVDATLYAESGAGIQFMTNGSSTAKATLDSSGNLGLGVTPSADWASSSYKAFVVRTSFLAGSTAPGVMVLGNNAYNDGAGWKYVATGVASYYFQNAGAHSWSYAPSGTAGNAITFTQAMTLDASGNLLLGGTTSKVTGVSGSGSGQTISGSVPTLALWSGATASNYFNLTQVNTDTYVWNLASGFMAFGTGNTERARIDSSGNLLVGDTALTLNSRIYALRNSNGIALAAKTTTTNDISLYCAYTGTTGTPYFGYWVYNGNVVGSISATASTTSYNTSSDYRLKHDIAPMTGALAKVAALKPVTYKWNADDSDGEGFIAHELAEVCPHAVTGEKDAVDEEGNPVYQGIDTSFLVATLTAAIKEQQALIQQLQADVAALKGN